MLLQAESELIRSLARRDLLFVFVNSFFTVLNDSTMKYRQMREEAAYENHDVDQFVQIHI